MGSLKFGAELQTFDQGSLKSTDNPNQPPSSTAHYQYTPGTDITWGTLVPADIELQFYYDRLIGIRLRFNDTNGNLIPVYRAVLEKYGSTHGGGNIQFSNFDSFNGPQWYGAKIGLCVCLPTAIPPQASENFLDQKVNGAVELIAVGLREQLTHEKQDSLRSELLKSQNLDKIKANL